MTGTFMNKPNPWRVYETLRVLLNESIAAEYGITLTGFTITEKTGEGKPPCTS